MRTLQVIPSLDPAYGGPAHAAKEIASLLRARGHEPHIATMRQSGAEWLSETGVRHHGFEGLGGYGLSVAFPRWLIRNRSHFDAIVVHGLWSFPTPAVRAALTGGGRIPYFVFPHGMLDPWFAGDRRKHAKKIPYWLSIERKVLADASGVLFTCEEECRLARQAFPGYRARETVTGYGIRDPRLDPDSQIEKFRSEYAVGPGRMVLYLSRLHPKKAPEVALRAFSVAIAADPELRLVVAGAGEPKYIETLKRHAAGLGVSDRITWTGLLTGDAKWGAMQAAELFVLPSQQENFGLVLAEALACGTPVVTTRGVNIWSEIEVGGGGLIAKGQDDFSQELAAAANWTRAEHARRSTLARQTYEDHFVLDRAVDKLEATLLSGGA